MEPLEDIAPPGDAVSPEDIVSPKDIVPPEDIVPLEAPVTAAPPSEDRLPSPVNLPGYLERNLIKRDGKMGVLVYPPGTTRLLFVAPRRLDDKLYESKEETLLKAARFGHEDAVALLLKGKANQEFQDKQGRTALLSAVEGSSVATVRLLLENNADWNAKDHSDRTALHLASLNGRTEAVQILLHNTEIDVNAQDNQGETALHLAARNGHQGAIEQLLAHDANVEAKDKKGFTALHLAAKRGGVAVVELLLSKSTDVEVRSNNGRTPLLQACERVSSQESEDVVKLLIEKGGNPATHDNNGETALFLGAWSGNRPIVECLLRRPVPVNALTDDRRSALFGPARFGFDDIAKLLLDAKIDSTFVDKAGRTALLESAKYDKTGIMRLILEQSVEKDAQVQGKLVQLALFEAAIHDSLQAARFLLEKGARIDGRERTGQETAVEIANRYGSQKVVALLLEKGGQLVSQGPSLRPQLPERLSEAGPNFMPLSDSDVDLGFGFKSTIVAFSVDSHENWEMTRPPLRSMLYDFNTDAIKTGLQRADSTSKNFRWLHIPSNNIVWVNNLITRMYKHCYSPEQASHFQKKCKHLFGEEIWKRHQYQTSSTSVAHRRFIRPICQRITMNEESIGQPIDDNNMMMVLPYFHWETREGRHQMTDVIVEAMKRHIEDPPPSLKSKLKGLDQALKELQKARNPNDDSSDKSDGETADESASYYSYTSTSRSSSSGRRTRVTRRSGTPKKPELPAGPDTDLVTKVSPDTLENDAIHETAATGPEEEKRKKKRIQRIVDVANEARSQDEKLILAYMFDEIPLHFRRTLDQYYYYTLPTTEARDTDQVVSRYFEKTWPDDENLVLMVDQLWLWILDKDTVVTSFPQRWNKTEKRTERDPDPNNASDIVESILRHIGKKDRRPLTSAFDLAELVVSNCVGTMFEHPDIANEKLRFSEFFEISIGNITNEESKLFNEFTDLSQKLAGSEKGDDLADGLDWLFDISSVAFD